MSDKYILEGREVRPCSDLLEWARRFEHTDRHVGRTEVEPGVTVSTVFLGVDHSFGDGPPLLFETMVFADGKETDGVQERYSTYEEAEAGHARICASYGTTPAPTPPPAG